MRFRRRWSAHESWRQASCDRPLHRRSEALTLLGRDVELVVVDSEQEVAAIVSNRLADAAQDGGNIVLTGGKTPKLAYEQAAKRQADWSRVELWWGDERCVPPD